MVVVEEVVEADRLGHPPHCRRAEEEEAEGVELVW